MKQRREQLLAGPGFAAQEHGDVARGHPLRGREHAAKFRALADDRFAQPSLRARPPLGLAQVSRLERALDHGSELVDVARLGQIVVGPGANRFDRFALAAPGSEQQQRQLGMKRAEPLQELEPVEIRHHQIADHQVRRLVPRERGQRQRAVRGLEHLVTALEQHFFQREPHVGVVVDHEHAAHEAPRCYCRSG